MNRWLHLVTNPSAVSFHQNLTGLPAFLLLTDSNKVVLSSTPGDGTSMLRRAVSADIALM